MTIINNHINNTFKIFTMKLGVLNFVENLKLFIILYFVSFIKE